MTLWCMFRSPLMIGAELTLLDEWTLSLLTNRELLACMGQTCHGMQIMRSEEQVIWKNEDTESGRLCVALFNISDTDAVLSVTLNELTGARGSDDGAGIDENAGRSGAEGAESEKTLYELWTKEESRTVSGKIEAAVPAHGVKVYRVGQ